MWLGEGHRMDTTRSVQLSGTMYSHEPGVRRGTRGAAALNLSEWKPLGGQAALETVVMSDMEMVDECDEDDTEELAGSLAESMRDAGARLPAF